MARRSFTAPALAVGLIRLFAVKIALTSNAAVRREEQPEMLPSLWDVSDEEPLTVKVWRPLPPERPEHISNIDWKKPSL
jgi:hypothetical protein